MTMKDGLVKSAFPTESEFQEWCEHHGGEFEDSDHSMSCTLEDDKIRMGVQPHSGPWISNEDSGIDLHPMTSTQKVFLDEDLIIVKDEVRGNLGDYISLSP